MTEIGKPGSRYAKIRERVYCPKARGMGFDKSWVETEDVILFETGYQDGSTSDTLGRVLGLVTHDGAGKPYPKKPKVLAVLVCDEMCTHAYERHVSTDRVVRVRDPVRYEVFAKWFFSSKMPSPEATFSASRYGCLADEYLGKHLDQDGNLPENWREIEHERMHKRYKGLP